jgi:hypothetical protein
MCTGWGDLVPAGSPPVTGPAAGGLPAPASSGPGQRRDLRVCRLVPDSAACRRPTVPAPGHDLGIRPGDTGDRGWTPRGDGEQPSRCPRVDNRTTVTAHNRPTGRSGGSPARRASIPSFHTCDDEDEGVISEILEPHSGWGRSAPRANRPAPRSTCGRGGGTGHSGAEPAHRGTGVSPRGTAAGTMSTAPTPDAPAPGRRYLDAYPSEGRCAELGWVER